MISIRAARREWEYEDKTFSSEILRGYTDRSISLWVSYFDRPCLDCPGQPSACLRRNPFVYSWSCDLEYVGSGSEKFGKRGSEVEAAAMPLRVVSALHSLHQYNMSSPLNL